MSEKMILSKIENCASYYKHPSYYLERKLLNALKRGSRAEAIETMTVINRLERARLADSPMRSMKNSLIASCTLFARAAIDANVPTEEAFSHSDVHIREIEVINQVKLLQQYEYTMLEDFFALIEHYRQEDYSTLTLKSIQYIHENITDQITLDQLATILNRSKSYISYTFKNEVGMNLTDYINMNKIEESKYFTKYTNMSISEIAFLFNFCNPSYYTNLFKKTVGMSPSEFRMSGTIIY